MSRSENFPGTRVKRSRLKQRWTRYYLRDHSARACGHARRRGREHDGRRRRANAASGLFQATLRTDC